MDVVIIGGGHAGRLLAAKCREAGLSVTVVDCRDSKPDGWEGEWIAGKGLLSSRGLVAVLDPDTGDERRLLQCKTVVVAIGKIDPANLPAMMLGITKYGAVLTSDKSAIICNDRGETSAEGIYATGSCASTSTPYILESLVSYCTSSLAER